MGNLGSWMQGPIFQDKIQHNALEPEAPRCFEHRRKAGRREQRSRSWLSMGGKVLDLSHMKHKMAKPTHAPGRTATHRMSHVPGAPRTEMRCRLNRGKGAVQAGKPGHKRGPQASCSIKTALEVPETQIAEPTAPAQQPRVLLLSGDELLA